MSDGTITTTDGRTVGFADFGPQDGTPVLWFHGGPGSRLEPQPFAAEAAEHGIRFIGIDRPGYGLSTPQPGRTIADWVPDGLAVADHLGIDRFGVIGVSTGGAYALATAAASDRVLGVVACCALTDMSWQEGRATAMANGFMEIWDAPDRDAAMACAVDLFGNDGMRMLERTGEVGLAESDMQLLSDPAFLMGFAQSAQAMFAQGVIGYADDRIADGVGWVTFDVSSITCPVIVLHGEADTICPVAYAHHTASIVPDAQLRTVPDLGHFSILSKAVEAVHDVLAAAKP